MSKFIKDTSNTKIVSGIKIECAYREIQRIWEEK